MTNRKRMFAISAITCLLLSSLIITCRYLYISNNTFKITNYNITSNKNISDLRIVMVTDLHLKEYGENNKDLLDEIKSQSPDLIAIVGDSTIYGVEDYSSATRFLNDVSKIAPSYFSPGNHEWSYIYHKKNYQLLSDLKNSNTKFLKNELEEIELDGNKIVICGAYDESDAKWGHTNKIFPVLNDKKYDTYFKLVLSHYPTMIQHAETTPNADLVLSGHEHGGQVIIPIINKGLFSRNQGWFPKYTQGIHEIANNLVIISTGLSNSYYWIPRINNQPELVVIDVNTNNI